MPLPDFFAGRVDFLSFRDFFDHFRFFLDAGCVKCDVIVNSIADDVVNESVTIVVVVVISGVVDMEVDVIAVDVVGGDFAGVTSFGDFFGFKDNSFFSFRGKISSKVSPLWYVSLSSQNWSFRDS